MLKRTLYLHTYAVRPDFYSVSKALTSKLLSKINPAIARPLALPESPNCAWQLAAPVLGPPRHSPYSNYSRAYVARLCRAPDIAAIGTIFNVFSYDALISLHFTSQTTSGCTTCCAIVAGCNYINELSL